MKNFSLAAILCLTVSVSSTLVNAQQSEPGEALLAKIEAKWGGVMVRIRGWNAEGLRQFREGYAGYPVEVLEHALAARSFERMMDALDTHAAVRSQQVMEKALSKAHSMAETLPEDAANARLVEARQLVAKSLGDDARDLVFIPITPCTVWDTRFATNPDSAGIIANAQTKKFYSHLDGAGGSYAAYGGNPSCPETAQNFIGFRPFAVMMTVYINDATAQGWLTLYRDGDPDPSNATISVYYSPGPTRTQTVISKSSRGYGSGTYDIAATSRFANTHASASITGYFVKVAEVGTVSSVATGPGLTGGPITTTGTIGLAATNLLPTFSCPNTSIPRWNNGVWVCSSDANSGGTVTGVTASAPLASTGGNTPNISLTGTIPVANGGTGATSLASNGVVYGQGTSAVGTAIGAAGQVLAGNAGAPAFTGSPSISGSLTLVHPSTAVAGNIMKGANRFIHNFGIQNTFIGENAGNFAMTGSFNTATGYIALLNNTTGSLNTASGVWALTSNSTGSNNTTSGYQALTSNSTGNSNTASGMFALVFNTAGNNNTASGQNALRDNTNGSNNIAIGMDAGRNLTTGSFNIDIGNQGVAAEGNTIRIGDGNQTRAFIAGIRGRTTGIADAVAVFIDSNGQLGTVSSSRRFKDEIADMDAASHALMKLRPVTFHYKSDASPSGRTLQYGLIAEEVAAVYPGLVAHSADGQVETVMYQFLPSMLLNEYQKQQRTIQTQARDAIQYKARLVELEQDRQVQAVEIAGLKRAVAEFAEFKQQMAHMARLLEQRQRTEAVSTGLILK